jgi:hypothetical protein
LALGSTLYAQSFEEYKLSQLKSFEDDKAKKEKEFRNFLTSKWKAYKESQGLSIYEKPKPKILPSVLEKKHTPIGPVVVIKPPRKKEPVHIKEVKKEVPKITSKPLDNLVLFGSTFSFEINDSLKKGQYFPKSKKGITRFFDTLAQSNYKKIVDTLALHVKQKQLNDWALYLLSQKLSHHIYSDDDEARLFQWFILNHLGFDIKVALQNERIVLLCKSKNLIYATPNYTLSKHRYYAIDFYNKKGLGSLKTYEGRYPDAEKSLNLALKQIPKLSENTKERVLEFRYRGQKHSLHVKYNQNLIDFMASYPQADYDAYFNAPLDYKSSLSLAKALRPIIDGKVASEAINILLFFVQHAFIYEVDQDQFGREKVMFAEETLYYKKSDCEDRSILFAYLVKNLLGYGVVGVKYSDHMATAVAVPIKGDSLNIASHRYVIADPTYINAPIGKSMPKYKHIRPEKYIQVN